MKIGIVGARGMVGSVLVERMLEEDDFDPKHDWSFYSTSQHGQKGTLGKIIENANDPLKFKNCDVIVTCQGGDWSKKMFGEIKKTGWNGIWLDASSAFRMNDDSIIVLDPINSHLIHKFLREGGKIFTGGNCTVSLMLMALWGLIQKNSIDWINADTYQAASGAGAKYMKELIDQMRYIGMSVPSSVKALELDRRVRECLLDDFFPKENFGVPLSCNIIPWIDSEAENGLTREEWKGYAETNKILCTSPERPILVDGTCVRVGAMRCHSQALLVKMSYPEEIETIRQKIAEGNQWVKVIKNEKESTVHDLSPAAVSGSLSIHVGRIRHARYGKDYIRLFTVGDQLLWGAAEPIRRALKIICEHL